MTTQRTITKDGELEGSGLHTGARAVVSFKPAAPETGVHFFKFGKPVALKASSSVRCTAIGEGEDQILTVEHLLAAVMGLGLTDLNIDVCGPEIPGLDGSALDFVRFFKTRGLVPSKNSKPAVRIHEPLFCHEDKKALCVYPSETFSVSYILDYDHAQLKGQIAEFEITPEIFESEIAPARTFCTESEAKMLKASGLGAGATTDNTLVMSESGPIANSFRFKNECAVHKVLDLVGDLGLLGFPILGRVVALRSGHSLNRKLAEAILKQKEGL